MALSYETTQDVTKALCAMGIAATFEYPGVIAVTVSAEYVGNFGDGNGPLGGDLIRIIDDKPIWSWEGAKLDDTRSPQAIGQMTDAIAGAVAEMRKKADIDWRIQRVLDATDGYVGNKLVEVFPESDGGDIDPLVDASYRLALRNLVENWVDLNVASKAEIREAK